MAVPVIHQTDLFHPHADPDDHWDLACVYALAAAGKFRLQGMLIDHPPNPQYGNPAVYSVAQLNRITGLAAPVAVGSSVEFSRDGQLLSELPLPDRGGAEFVLGILRNSSEPVVIHIVGSSRDIALAGKAQPNLFEEKCRAIYLNAGTGTNDLELKKNKEYNVGLDPLAFQTIFDLPCPVYWMPCFQALIAKGPQKYEAGPHGTIYSFAQDEILPYLSSELQRYFLFMFERSADQRWLSYLSSPNDASSMAHYGKMLRKMWCTAGFFHSVGLSVDAAGNTIDDRTGGGVFSFQPVRISCDSNGITTWEHTTTSQNRFIFTREDAERYDSAMKKAMKALLERL